MSGHNQLLDSSVSNDHKTSGKVRVPLSPGLALLSLTIETLPIEARTVTIHILLSARLVLAGHWKDQVVPSIQEVITTSNMHAAYELLFASTQGKLQEASCWKIWSEWYKKDLRS